MKRYIRLFKNVSNWWKHFAVKFGLTSEDPVVFLLPNGVKMEVPMSLYHEFKEIFLEDCYLRGLRGRLPERPLVLDIGANGGFFCLYIAQMRPGARIICCEPIAANIKQLSRNAQINPHVDITVLPVAVYATTGRLELLVEEEGSFTTAATVFPLEGRIPVDVPSISLEDLIRNHGIECVDLVKLDCEGSEYEILYRCSPQCLARIRRMAVEVHEGTLPNHNLRSMASFLKNQGFSVRTSGQMLWAHRDCLSPGTVT
jgi:FkbM family methyltransferase